MELVLMVMDLKRTIQEFLLREEEGLLIQVVVAEIGAKLVRITQIRIHNDKIYIR
jgi:hypothetical protein